MRNGELLEAPFIDWTNKRVINRAKYLGKGRPRFADYTTEIIKNKKLVTGGKKIKKPNKPATELRIVGLIWQVAIYMGFVASFTDLLVKIQERL